MSLKDIAYVTESIPTTVASKLSRTRKKLYKIIKMLQSWRRTNWIHYDSRTRIFVMLSDRTRWNVLRCQLTSMPESCRRWNRSRTPLTPVSSGHGLQQLAQPVSSPSSSRHRRTQQRWTRERQSQSKWNSRKSLWIANLRRARSRWMNLRQQRPNRWSSRKRILFLSSRLSSSTNRLQQTTCWPRKSLLPSNPPQRRLPPKNLR